MQPNRLFSALLLLTWVPGARAQELIELGTFKSQNFRTSRAELSPDCKVLAVGGWTPREGELKLWSVVTGKEIVSLPGATTVPSTLAFSADGARLAAGGQGPVQVWDVKTHKQIAVFKDLQYGASVVALNQVGTRVAAVGWRQARVWEVATGKELASFQHHVPVSGWFGVAFSRDLATLAARNYPEIDLWDTATGKEKASLSEHRGEVSCMVWSADDKTLMASSTRYEGKGYKWKGDVKLWDVASGKERTRLPGPFGRVWAIAASPDGKTLAVLDSPEVDEESAMKLVDVDTGRQRILRALPRCSFLSLRFTAEGKLLVIGTSGDALRLWEVSLPKPDAKP